MLTFGGRANQTKGALDKAMPSAIGEEEIETAAKAIEVGLIAGHELGFQMPAAYELFGRRYWGYGPRRSGGGAPDRIGRAGDHRAAYSATAGRKPVPLHHFGRGRRPSW